MIPDAIIIVSTGIKKNDAGTYIPTDYGDRDAFGTLGGIERVRAAAVLAERHTEAVFVTTCRPMVGESPTHARIYAEALRRFGVPESRIVREEKSTTTGSGVAEALVLARANGWARLMFLASEFHIPRIQAFWEQLPEPKPNVEYVSAESVLVPLDSAFAKEFEILKKTPAYHERLAAEARGIEAIKSGSYQSAPAEDKQERSV